MCFLFGFVYTECSGEKSCCGRFETRFCAIIFGVLLLWLTEPVFHNDPETDFRIHCALVCITNSCFFVKFLWKLWKKSQMHLSWRAQELLLQRNIVPLASQMQIVLTLWELCSWAVLSRSSGLKSENYRVTLVPICFFGSQNKNGLSVSGWFRIADCWGWRKFQDNFVHLPPEGYLQLV